jgi:signal transduction histidine kinase
MPRPRQQLAVAAAPVVPVAPEIPSGEAAHRQRLALAEERLDDITRLVSDWIWETDPELKLTFVSLRVTGVLGFHPRDLVGRSLLDIGSFFGEAAEGPPPLDPARRSPFRDLPFRIAHRDGTDRLFRLSSLPVFCSQTGAFLGFRGTARDVTVETEAWESAARSRAQLSEAIESISEGFSLFDHADRLVLCNSKFRAMFPNTAVVPGTSFETILREAVANADVRVAEGEREVWLERRLQLRSAPRASFEMQLGDGRWVKAGDRQTADGSTVGIRTDITELKNREQALLAAKELAEVASRSKTDFLANVSHELRTPLNAIIGFSEIMRDEIFGPIGSPQYRAYLRDVLDSAHHLLDVINDILDVTKAEAGKLDLDEAELEVSHLVASAMRLVQERAERAALTLRSDIAANMPLILVDERKMKQVLLNLLSNAVKFTPAGGTVEVAVRLAEDGGLLIEVVDTGIGIAEADIAVALSPFGQVDRQLNRKYEGTGLGLPLSQALIDLHGGRLSLASRVGKGTTVTIHLPAVRVRHFVELAAG